jgi:hypothetical protein
MIAGDPTLDRIAAGNPILPSAPRDRSELAQAERILRRILDTAALEQPIAPRRSRLAILPVLAAIFCTGAAVAAAILIFASNGRTTTHQAPHPAATAVTTTRPEQHSTPLRAGRVRGAHRSHPSRSASPPAGANELLAQQTAPRHAPTAARSTASTAGSTERSRTTVARAPPKTRVQRHGAHVPAPTTGSTPSFPGTGGVAGPAQTAPAPTHSKLVAGGAAALAGAHSTSSPAPSSCLKQTQGTVPANPWSAARQKLAPDDPTAILLCRYSGLDAQSRLTLTRSVTVHSASTIRELVAELDRLPQLVGPVACPFDDGSQIVAHLSYRDGRAVTIGIDLTGCNLVTNGDLHRAAFDSVGIQLLKQLDKLTGA